MSVVLKITELTTDILAPCRKLYRQDPGTFWHRCMFWTFWLHMAFFALGYGFREVMPPLAGIFLLLSYKYSWKDSTLCRVLKTPILFYFLCFWIMIFLGVLLSTNKFDSFLHAGMGINKAYILPFIGMECIRTLKDSKRLVYACCFALFWQGIDGIWQYVTGYDFIMGYPLHFNRLTGSLDDYWVGNYVAIMAAPACGIWYIFRSQKTASSSLILCCLLFAPAVFLFIGAGARAGVISIIGITICWAVLCHRLTWKMLLLIVGICCCFIYFNQHRSAIAFIAQDGRWNLWYLAVVVIRAFPFFGAGINQYNATFRALGLVPEHDEITISHPHNMYLDLLCSHGIVGTCLGLIFLFGVCFWLWKRLSPRLSDRLTGPETQLTSVADQLPGDGELYWRLTGLFFLGYVAWLFNGIFGHDFYRIWWLALAMTYLGIAIGAVVRGIEAEKRSVPTSTVSQ